MYCLEERKWKSEPRRRAFIPLKLKSPLSFCVKKALKISRFFSILPAKQRIPLSKILKESICDRCGKCADVCPLGAIDKNNTTVVDICGKKMEVATVNYDICKTCKNGACVNRFDKNARPDRVAALCNRTCLCHLEEVEALGNRFENQFRQREVWSIGGKNCLAERDTESANVLGGSFSKDGNRGNRS